MSPELRTLNPPHDQMNNIYNTRLIGEQTRSIEPAGPSHKAMAFLALPAAGLAGYLGTGRRAMAPDRGVSEG